MDVYWSTIYPMDVYPHDHMLNKEPDPLFKSLLPERDTANPGDFFACPAFQDLADNMFIARATLTGDVGIRGEQFVPLNDRSQVTAQFFQWWPSSRKQYRVLNFDHRLLFFSEEPLTMSTCPAYMHRTDWQTKLGYVPASYDVSRWLRPLQGTFEVMPGVQDLNVREDDPMYYIKFHTDERVRLRRFKMVPEIHGVAHGCVHYKMFRPQSSMRRVYEAFEQSHLPRQVMDAIRANLLN
jgi:hypothetical protein